MVAENRGGASGNIATVAVRNATDGHTGLVHGKAFSVNPALYANPGFTIADFPTIAILGSTPAAFVVREAAVWAEVVRAFGATADGTRYTRATPCSAHGSVA